MSRTPAAVAVTEGLQYVTDSVPGIRRVRRGRSFVYFGPDGRRITDEAQLTRIRKLAIPPAYRDVWICPSPSGHLQATGRDARGRKQYRYHAQWRTLRDANKFDRILEFAHALPRIRRRVAADLRRSGLPRERVLAAIVSLLQSTLARVGNDEYARTNGSFGLTTLRDRHMSRNGAGLMLEFRGKSGIPHKVRVDDPRVARVVRRCKDIPGQELFQWIDDSGERRRICSNDVNDYLREISGGSFTAKDFRTWFATVEAWKLLCGRRPETAAQGKKQAVEAVATVAQRLGNTPAVCRKCYIHPVILDSYLEGRLAGMKAERPEQALPRLLRPGRRPKAARLTAPAARAWRPHHGRAQPGRETARTG